jgi:hypothetical protein
MSGLSVILYGSPSVKIGAGQIGFDEFCPCDFICDYEERVFSDSSGDTRKSDLNEVIFKKVKSSDSIVLKLYRYGQEVATLNDDTFGTYYNGFDNQPLYVAYLVDWEKVFQQFTGGQYQIKAELDILGAISTVESRYFRLSIWSELSANRTVKIRSVQNGNILRSEFDYTDLLPGGWNQYIRLQGQFGNNTPAIESDNFLNTSYEKLQNQDIVTNEYELKVENIPEELVNKLTNDNILGNQIFVTDYYLQASAKYIDFPVYVDSISDVSPLPNGRMNLTLICKDRIQDVRKRNY